MACKSFGRTADFARGAAALRLGGVAAPARGSAAFPGPTPSRGHVAHRSASRPLSGVCLQRLPQIEFPAHSLALRGRQPRPVRGCARLHRRRPSHERSRAPALRASFCWAAQSAGRDSLRLASGARLLRFHGDAELRVRICTLANPVDGDPSATGAPHPDARSWHRRHLGRGLVRAPVSSCSRGRARRPARRHPFHLAGANHGKPGTYVTACVGWAPLSRDCAAPPGQGRTLLSRGLCRDSLPQSLGESLATSGSTLPALSRGGEA